MTDFWLIQAFACFIFWCALGIIATVYYITKD